jgi:hypothetical protein
MIKVRYSEEHQAVLAERLITVAMYDRNDGILQDALLKRIARIGSEANGLRSIPFSEDLWAEILEEGVILDDDERGLTD